MKLTVNLETDFDEKCAQYMCLASALGKIQTAITEENSAGTVGHSGRNNGYEATWKIEKGGEDGN